MFENFKAKVAQQKAGAALKRADKAQEVLQRKQQVAANEINDQIADLQSLLSIANGTGHFDSNGLMLKAGEVLVCFITNCSLIEQRRAPGTYKGKSAGVSVPIGSIKGYPIRYRVGASRGHYVQGEEHPTATDHGTMSVTNQRIVYQGAAKTSECLFTKLLGIDHTAGEISISVSNRQKPTTIHFGSSLDDWLSNRLTVAIALFHGEGAQAAAQLQTQIEELKKSLPATPDA